MSNGGNNIALIAFELEVDVEKVLQGKPWAFDIGVGNNEEEDDDDTILFSGIENIGDAKCGFVPGGLIGNINCPVPLLLSAGLLFPIDVPNLGILLLSSCRIGEKLLLFTFLYLRQHFCAH